MSLAYTAAGEVGELPKRAEGKGPSAVSLDALEAGRHARVPPRFERVEREGRGAAAVGTLRQFIRLSGCGVSETHRRSPMTTKGSRSAQNRCATVKTILLLKIDFNFILG